MTNVSSHMCISVLRQTPSYSQLCIVAMFFNPVVGGMAYLLNKHAQRMYRARSLNRANFWYWAAICISTTAIFVTVAFVLLIPVLHPLPVALQHGCDEAYSKEYMRKYTKTFDIDENVFCGIIKHKKLMEVLDKYIEENPPNDENQTAHVHIFPIFDEGNPFLASSSHHDPPNVIAQGEPYIEPEIRRIQEQGLYNDTIL